MAYFDTKKGSLEESIKSIGEKAPKIGVDRLKQQRDKDKAHADAMGRHVKSGRKKSAKEELDAVNKTAVKKKFDDRKDKDIDNDGDVDASDKFLHKRRKAVSKAIKNDESFEYGTPEATENSLKMTPGQSSQEWDEQVGLMHKKQNTMREAIAKMWGVDEGQTKR